MRAKNQPRKNGKKGTRNLIGLLTLVVGLVNLFNAVKFISQRLTTMTKVYAKPFVSLTSLSKRLKGLVNVLHI